MEYRKCPQCGRRFSGVIVTMCPRCGIELVPDGEATPQEPEPAPPTTGWRRPLELDESPAKPPPAEHPEEEKAPQLPAWAEPDAEPLMPMVEEGLPGPQPAVAAVPTVGPAPETPKEATYEPLGPGEDKRLIDEASAVFRRPWEDNQQAIQSLLRVLNFDPSNARARALLADIYETEGQYELAIEQCQTFLQQDPTNLRMRKQLERLQEIQRARQRAAALQAQPPVVTGAPVVTAAPIMPQPTYPQPYAGQPLQPFSTWAVAALVTSLLCCPLIGLVFSIVALNEIAQSNKRGKGVAIAALVISIIGLVFGVLGFIGAMLGESGAGGTLPITSP